MVRALAGNVAAAFEVGDTKAARVAIEALRGLVEVAASEGTSVVDLADERAKRDREKGGRKPASGGEIDAVRAVPVAAYRCSKQSAFWAIEGAEKSTPEEISEWD
jgi:hypothetical protein